MNQREKAARIKAAEKVKAAGVAAGEFLPVLQAEWLMNSNYLKYLSFSTGLAIDLQVAVDEAVELMRDTVGQSGSYPMRRDWQKRKADWLSRNERKEI